MAVQDGAYRQKEGGDLERKDDGRKDSPRTGVVAWGEIRFRQYI
jgi:hypothetical protein